MESRGDHICEMRVISGGESRCSHHEATRRGRQTRENSITSVVFFTDLDVSRGGGKRRRRRVRTR
eukprot:scaffold133962_cov20-Tisochrysis_lutea.AAC.1